MLKTIIIYLILLLPTTSFSQKENSQQIMTSFDGGSTGAYKAYFEFIDLPQPLKVARVKYSIEMLYDDAEPREYHNCI